MYCRHHHKPVNLLLLAYSFILFTSIAGCSTDPAAASNADTILPADVAAGSSYHIDWKSRTPTSFNLADGPVHITSSGIYELSGTLTEGNITVDIKQSDDKDPVYLILNGIDISSSAEAPIHIKAAAQVILVLETDTVNTIIQNAPSDDSSNSKLPAGAIHTKADTIITGGGTLELNTTHNDGINCKGNLIISGVDFHIDAADDGIVVKDSLLIEDSNITLNAGDDAVTAAGEVTVRGDSIDIQSSYEGIEGSDITIYGGKISIVSADDGLNIPDASGTLTINDGSILLKCAGDPIDSNGSLTVNDGHIIIDTDAITGNNMTLDYDGIFTFNGGIITDSDGNELLPQKP